MDQATSFDDDGRTQTRRPSLARPCTITREDEREFQRAMEAYIQKSGRLFPTWSEVLEVLLGLGYAKRIWKPVDPIIAPAPHLMKGASASFQPMGEDSATGVFCWYSRVETPAEF